MKMHIICSTDKKFIMPTGVMIKSVSVNNEEADIVFHVIVDDTVSKKSQMYLSNVVKDNDRHVVEFHLFDEKYMETFPQIGIHSLHISKATYYRLFVDKILNSDIDKVLYLDTDIIVDKSLETLWNSDISNFAVGCVTDMLEASYDYNRLRFDSKQGYFNAGVLLINLKYWREHHVTDDFMDIINNHPEMILQHDQDVLNIVFHDKKYSLPLSYNVQSGYLFKPKYIQMDYEKYKNELNAAINCAIIIHYCGNCKPWHKDCEHPLREKWLKYLYKTRWRNYRLKGHPLPLRTKVGNFLRKHHLLKPRYKELWHPFMDLKHSTILTSYFTVSNPSDIRQPTSDIIL